MMDVEEGEVAWDGGDDWPETNTDFDPDRYEMWPISEFDFQDGAIVDWVWRWTEDIHVMMRSD